MYYYCIWLYGCQLLHTQNSVQIYMQCTCEYYFYVFREKCNQIAKQNQIGLNLQYIPVNINFIFGFLFGYWVTHNQIANHNYRSSVHLYNFDVLTSSQCPGLCSGCNHVSPYSFGCVSTYLGRSLVKQPCKHLLVCLGG